MNPMELCDLVDGRLEAWHGLGRLDAGAVPACVGTAQHAEWLGFSRGRLHYRRYQTASGAAVWLFDRDGFIVLVEHFPAGDPPVEPWLEVLGAPDRTIEYGVAQLMQRPLARTDEDVDELVWGARGLALLRGRTDRGERLIRTRGFAPGDADDYRRRFVELPRIEYGSMP